MDPPERKNRKSDGFSTGTMKLIQIRAVPYARMRVRRFSAREYLLAPIITYIITTGPVRSMISR